MRTKTIATILYSGCTILTIFLLIIFICQFNDFIEILKAIDEVNKSGYKAGSLLKWQAVKSFFCSFAALFSCGFLWILPNIFINHNKIIYQTKNQVEEMQKVTCPKCGAKVEPDNQFCPKCGEKIEK